MKSAEEIRGWFLELLPWIVRRPMMYGVTGLEVEHVLGDTIQTLAFIEERLPEWERVQNDLIHRGIPSCRGAAGRFQEVAGEGVEYLEEVASVYATAAHRMGYLPIESRLTKPAFDQLREGLRGACRGRDWREHEVRDQFGEPSLMIGRSVLAYIGDHDPEAWICFDLGSTTGHFRDHDYLLRDVRLPGPTFARQFTFTPHGRRMRKPRNRPGGTGP